MDGKCCLNPQGSTSGCPTSESQPPLAQHKQRTRGKKKLQPKVKNNSFLGRAAISIETVRTTQHTTAVPEEVPLEVQERFRRLMADKSRTRREAQELKLPPSCNLFVPMVVHTCLPWHRGRRNVKCEHENGCLHVLVGPSPLHRGCNCTCSRFRSHYAPPAGTPKLPRNSSKHRHTRTRSIFSRFTTCGGAQRQKTQSPRQQRPALPVAINRAALSRGNVNLHTPRCRQQSVPPSETNCYTYHALAPISPPFHQFTAVFTAKKVLLLLPTPLQLPRLPLVHRRTLAQEVGREAGSGKAGSSGAGASDA